MSKLQEPKYHIKAKFPLSEEEKLIEKDIVKAGLIVKHEWQIAEMLTSHALKIDRIQKALDHEIRYRQIKIETRIIEKGFAREKVETNVDDEILFLQNKLKKLNETVYLLSKDLEFRLNEKVDRSPIGTTYYIDPSTASGQLTGTWTFTNASTSVTANSDGNAIAELAVGDYIKVSNGERWYRVTVITDDDTLTISPAFNEGTVTDTTGATDYRDVSVAVGTSTANSFVILTQFTGAARSAGDNCIVRRGTSEYIDVNGGLSPASDGTPENPIKTEADYDDTWSDFANSTQTYTPVFGSKTMEASDTITGISAGDWIYNSTDGDDPREFAYEVASVSGTTLTLYLPYKGSVGATKTLKNMGSAPVYGEPSSTAYIYCNNDWWYSFQGIQFQGHYTNGFFYTQTNQAWLMKDCIFIGNGTTGEFTERNVNSRALFWKCRIKDFKYCLFMLNQDYVSNKFNFRDCILDGNSIASSIGVYLGAGVQTSLFEECEIINFAIGINSISLVSKFMFRGLKLTNNTVDFSNADDSTAPHEGQLYFEDYDNTVGDSRYKCRMVENDGDFLFQSETTKVRSGGSNKSIKVLPTINIGSSPLGLLKLFEIPIYATTDSKTYTVYFACDDNTDWDDNPLAGELYIEASYLGHASNYGRVALKSTGTVDFKTDTDFDQSLAITIAPAQAGLLYLRCFYGKPKEATNVNIFYVDPIPVIS